MATENHIADDRKKVRLIDANALRQTMESNLYWGLDSDGAILDTIDEAPTVDAVEVVHGRWHEKCVAGFNRGFSTIFICSECEKSYRIPNMSYCPNCGAKMDRERRTDG